MSGGGTGELLGWAAVLLALVVPPHGVLVVTWRHGEHRLDSGFRLSDSSVHERWAHAISRLSKEHQA